jgi:hypothetical protein
VTCGGAGKVCLLGLIHTSGKAKSRFIDVRQMSVIELLSREKLHVSNGLNKPQNGLSPRLIVVRFFGLRPKSCSERMSGSPEDS